MSNIAEVYSRNLGAKISKPKLTEHFFPVLSKDYIVLSYDNMSESQQYVNWHMVNKLLLDRLKAHNIEAIQISYTEKDGITAKQKNYLIKNAKLLLGSYSHYTEVANTYDVPSVCLLANAYKSTVPDNKNCHLICPDFSKIKPCFSHQDPQKLINTIKPEDVVNLVFEKLNLDDRVLFKTIYCGDSFNKDQFEVIPNFFGVPNKQINQPITIRGDVHFDEDYMVEWSSLGPCGIVTNQVLDLDKFSQFKNNIKKLVYRIESLENDVSEFLKNLKNINISVVLITKNKDIISDLRLKYFDFDVYLENLPDLKSLVTDKTKYASNKIVFSKNNVYDTIFNAKMLDNSNNFVLNKDSQEEIQNLYLYE